MTTILYDLEGNGLLDTLHTLHCLCLATPDGPVRTYHDDPDLPRDGTLEEGFAILRAADEIVAHNQIGYDIKALGKIYPDWDFSHVKQTDTLVLSRLLWSNMKELDGSRRYEGFPGRLWGRHSLESWGMRLGTAKGEYTGDFQTLDQAMLDYCIQDVVVLQALWAAIARRNYSQQAIDLEHAYARVIDAMNSRGIQFNVTKALAVQRRLEIREAEVEDKLAKAFTNFEKVTEIPFSTSPSYMVPAFQSIGWDPTAFTATGKAKLTAKILSELVDGAGPLGQAAGRVITLKLLKNGDDPEEIEWAGLLETQLKTTFGRITRSKTILFNPGSRNHLAKALMEQRGWEPKEYGNDGKPTMNEEIMAKLDYPEMPDIMESLMLDKRLGQLVRGRTAWLDLVGDDGIMKPYVCHLGTIYSRDSHSRPNITQVVKPSKPWGPEFRDLWEPRPGYTLLGVDLKGIDLRVLGHYLVPFDGGKYKEALAAGDPHTFTQKLVGLKERDTAKTLIYALIFGCYPKKVASIVGCSLSKAKRLHSGILNGLGITALVDAASRRAKSNGGFLRGLDGRMIPIRKKSVTLNYLIACGSAVVSKQWAVEFVASTIDYDCHLVIRAHDEMAVEVREEDAYAITVIALETALGAGKHLGLRVPTPADAKVGNSWKDIH